MENIENIENIDNLTIETIYKMVLEMKSKLDFLESETHVPQSDKASSFMESIEPRLSKVETDIVEMKANIKSIELRLGKVETEIVEMRKAIANNTAEQSKLRGDMKAELSKLRGDMKAELSKLRSDMYKWGLVLTASIIVSVSSIISVVVIFAT